MTEDVTLLDGLVVAGDRQIGLPHPAEDAFVLDGLLVVLYVPSSESGKVGQFNNLVALGESGEPVWIAELPTTETADCYYRVRSRTPLVVLSVKSFVCTLDPATGQIIEKEFVK